MVRLAKYEDIKQILIIIQDAVTSLKEMNVDQWQNGYPNEEVIKNDIDKKQLFVLEEDGVVLGFEACILGVDTTYNIIYDGEWLSDKPYLTIHRLAVLKSARRKNVAGKMIDYACEYAKKNNAFSLRIDTHNENIPMHNMVIKNGFVECGWIYLVSGEKRNAYERLL